MKKFVIAALLLLMVGSTTLAFAWWDSLQVDREDIVIGIGEGVTLQVSVDPAISGELVPAGVIAQPNQVTSVTLNYTVTLDREVSNPLTLEVEESNVRVGGNETLGQFIGFDISLSSPTVQLGSSVDVTIVVTLELTQAVVEAENLDLDNFRNQDIEFDLTFKATQQ